MGRFQYKCIDTKDYIKNIANDVEGLNHMLNRLGQEGWRLISITTDSVAIFIREVPDVDLT